MKNILELQLKPKLSAEQISYKQLNFAMPSIDPETKLISDLKRGRRNAQEKFYIDYFPSMFPIAFRFSASKEEAHEIINTAFMNVIKGIHKYSNDNFSGWVSTIVRRTAIDYYRKIQQHKTQNDCTSRI